MKLTNKLALLVAVISLSACMGSGVKQQPLANGDIQELATLSNLETQASMYRLYRGGNVIAQEAVMKNSVTGDVVRAVVPIATGQLIARNTAITVQGMKNDAPGSPAVVNNVQGAQAVSNSNAEQAANATTTTLGPCGLPNCPTLGRLDK